MSSAAVFLDPVALSHIRPLFNQRFRRSSHTALFRAHFSAVSNSRSPRKVATRLSVPRHTLLVKRGRCPCVSNDGQDMCHIPLLASLDSIPPRLGIVRQYDHVSVRQPSLSLTDLLPLLAILGLFGYCTLGQSPGVIYSGSGTQNISSPQPISYSLSLRSHLLSLSIVSNTCQVVSSTTFRPYFRAVQTEFLPLSVFFAASPASCHISHHIPGPFVPPDPL